MMKFWSVYGSSRSPKDIKQKIYTLEELKILLPLFVSIENEWTYLQSQYVEKNGDNSIGTCVLGAGFCVWYKGPRKRNAVLVYVVEPKGYQGCQIWEDSKEIIDQTLKRYNIQTEYMYGRMD